MSVEPEKMQRTVRDRVPFVAAMTFLLLAGLPVAVWLDLRNLSDQSLRTQSLEMSNIINVVRSYYARNIVRRVLSAQGNTKVVHNYKGIPGAIPIPATLSIELGTAIKGRVANVSYRFVSDYPFKYRAPHKLDDFERRALAALRKDPESRQMEVSGTLFDRQVRLVTPVRMGKSCVTCHNSHVESSKTDWKVGDVRGIQEIVFRQPIAANIFAFKFLLIYLVVAALFGIGFILMQRRQTRLIQGMNSELSEANDFLAAISMKIAKYLSPQVYKSIFSGERDVVVATERKKLTIFFSDIVNFTETTERLQPEEITALLNEYLTEMSTIALQYGATLDKFIGDAILAFFGDPETLGVEEDAKACLRMALAMQRRLDELNAEWRGRGIEQPFRVRMGINTGYCNVGNFGSADRMDYTIIGAEANLAARLETIAEPGTVVMSYETYALVRDQVRARPLAPIRMKGISHEVVPYLVEGVLGEVSQRSSVIAEHQRGLDLFVDPDAMDADTARAARDTLNRAIAALEAHRNDGPADR